MKTEPNYARLLLIAWIAAYVVFLGFGSVDLGISGLFERQGDFPWGHTPRWEWMRNTLWNIEIFVFIASLAALVWSVFRGGKVLGLTSRVWGYITALYIIAPILVVNGLLKEHWGRARPADVLELGGHKVFSRAWIISDQCHRNCSFSSGETASAVTLTVVCWVLAARLPGLESWHRNYIRAFGIFVTVFVPLQRLMAGRHFASDILFSALIVLTTALVLRPLLTERSEPQV